MSPIITCMSRVPSHIGFGLTYASTFMHPFYVARLFNSLDHVTNGRIAFNVIASSRNADAANYGFDELMEHGQRYDRRVQLGPRDRGGRRSRQGACDQPRRQVLQGARSAQLHALAADLSGA